MTQSKRLEVFSVEETEEALSDWMPKEDLRQFAGEWVALRRGYVVEHDLDLARLREHPQVWDDDVFLSVPRRGEITRT
jgi:hypothetical protein